MPIPSKRRIQKLYKTKTDAELADLFMVSEATIRRWRRHHGILSKPRGPRSAIGVTKFSDAKVQKAVKASYSVAGVLRFLGMAETGSGHASMKRRIERLGFDTSHFGRRVSVLGGSGHKRPLD